jgi:hypothetical protein
MVRNEKAETRTLQKMTIGRDIRYFEVVLDGMQPRLI